MKKVTLILLASLTALAAAQEIQPVNPTTPAPAPELQPVTPSTTPAPTPVSVTPSETQAPTLTGVTATLSAPFTLTGKTIVVLTLKSTLDAPVTLLTRRDNRQDCAFAPMVRVIQVGSRDLVYPNTSGNAKLCAQDMNTETLKAKGSVRYTRTLELPAGEYMVEGWFQGIANDQQVRIPAQPIRVTVK